MVIRTGGFAMMRKVLLVAISLVLLMPASAQESAKKVISTPNAPEAIGPYSQAVRAGKAVYLAGQIAIDPKTKQLMASASIEEQTRLVLENLQAVLTADGLTMDNVVSTTVFLKDLNEFAKMNEVYATLLQERAAGARDRRGGAASTRREGRDRRHRLASVSRPWAAHRRGGLAHQVPQRTARRQAPA
jgi:2-iminobutanoate/2-iminopropanoate deaminase